MISSAKLSPGWAAHVLVEDPYRETWLKAYQPPFDHWIETDPDGLYLRSTLFDTVGSAKELKPIAVDLLRSLRGAIVLTVPTHKAQFLDAVHLDADSSRGRQTLNSRWSPATMGRGCHRGPSCATEF